VLADYVKVIREVCCEEGLCCLDLHEGFPFDWRRHTLDGCHPNAEGHRLLAEAVTAELKRLMKQ
jgi:lysophospholipase L1-like esterase